MLLNLDIEHFVKRCELRVSISEVVQHAIAKTAHTGSKKVSPHQKNLNPFWTTSASYDA